MPVDWDVPKLKAGAAGCVKEGASNEGMDGFGAPNAGVAPILGPPNIGICGAGLLAGCGVPNSWPDA